jgi:DNA-directed RNA polymerase specialized sigma24 family protein
VCARQRCVARSLRNDPHAVDPLAAVARVAAAKRDVLLRAYRTWAVHEDLEDCYSQATLELLVRARRDGGFQGDAHIANALEQKLCSRIRDRRRALAGRSAAEAARAAALRLGEAGCGGVEVADPRARTEDAVATRLEFHDLLRLARSLSHDQRVALACHVHLDESTRELAMRLGWSQEKYRKVSQRARARLRRLMREAGLSPDAHDVGIGVMDRTTGER